MNTAESIVNTYAWTKATRSSRQFMNSSMTMLNELSPSPNPTPIDHPRKMTHVKLNMTACPAIMLAKRRIMSANGLVNTPKSSITGITGTGYAFRKRGTSGQKISFQYSLLPKRLMAIIVHTARNSVMLMFPVTLAPPGKIGMSPIMLVMRIKKKTVRR